MNAEAYRHQLVDFLKARHDIVQTLGRQLLVGLLQLAILLLIARQLGPEGNGIYSMALLLPILASTFLSFGVAPATVYYVGRAEIAASDAIHTNVLLAFFISVAGVLILTPLIWFFGGTIFPGISRTLLWLSLASFPLALSIQLLNSVNQAKKDFRTFNRVLLVPPAITLVCVFAAINLFNGGPLSCVAAYLAGQIAGLLIVLIGLRQHVNKPAANFRDLRNLTETVPQLLRYGWKAHLANVFAYVNYRSDIFLVNFFTSPAVTGIYVVAVQLAEKLWMLSQAASTVLLPRLAGMHAVPGNRNRLALRYAGGILIITLFASLALGILLFFFSGLLFGPAYSQVVKPFFFLLPGIVAGAASRILANCIAAAGKPEWNLLTSIGVVIANISGNIVLIPIYGMVGAATATSIAYIGNGFIKWYQIRRLA